MERAREKARNHKRCLLTFVLLVRAPSRKHYRVLGHCAPRVVHVSAPLPPLTATACPCTALLAFGSPPAACDLGAVVAVVVVVVLLAVAVVVLVVAVAVVVVAVAVAVVVLVSACTVVIVRLYVEVALHVLAAVVWHTAEQTLVLLFFFEGPNEQQTVRINEKKTFFRKKSVHHDKSCCLRTGTCGRAV